MQSVCNHSDWLQLRSTEDKRAVVNCELYLVALLQQCELVSWRTLIEQWNQLHRFGFLVLPVSATFVPQHNCNVTMLGTYCNISAKPCDMMNPCENDGTCNNSDTTFFGFVCMCAVDFNGTLCELDLRPCQSNPCLNGEKAASLFSLSPSFLFCSGICNVTRSQGYYCNCSAGWEGKQCEKKVNYCLNATCQNNGVCRPLLNNYQCECLGTSYSGRNCEITSSTVAVYIIVSKSFGHIAIIALVSVSTLVVVMDVLKYAFGIDPAREELERLERQKLKKIRRQPVIQRFIYVHGLSTSSPSDV